MPLGIATERDEISAGNRLPPAYKRRRAELVIYDKPVANKE
jgi:hypothetical protein